MSDLLKEVITRHRRVVFNGDNYSDEWHQEAERRGLPNITNSAEALAVLDSQRAKDIFTKYGVLNNDELKARVKVLREQYNTIVCIEARTLVSMIKTEVHPAGLRYQSELAETVSATQAAGLACPDTVELLTQLISLNGELSSAVREIENHLSPEFPDLVQEADHVRKNLIPAMEQARVIADALEQITPDDLWPLPTYAEMLFIR